MWAAKEGHTEIAARLLTELNISIDQQNHVCASLVSSVSFMWAFYVCVARGHFSNNTRKCFPLRNNILCSFVDVVVGFVHVDVVFCMCVNCRWA